MSHFIKLDEAKKMTSAYRQKKKDLIDPKYKGKDVLPISESFDRAAFDKLLSHPKCTGIRIYYGLKNGDEVHAVIVAHDADNKDILPSDVATVTEGVEVDIDAEIVEIGTRCPPGCAPASPLNT
jgi:hypothetical protein